MTNKEIFIETYNKNIHRPGAEKLLAWLEGTDFFTAPASTRFHAAYEGGLLDHSLNVYNVLISKHFNPETDDLESYTIVSLLHDLCKAGFYKTELRNRKNDRGEWEKVPVYAVDDQFPYGHGEKSVFLIERFMRLLRTRARVREVPACRKAAPFRSGSDLSARKPRRMSMKTREFSISTDHEGMYNITARLREVIRESGVQSGLAVVYCPHTTAGITINENADPDVQHDLLLGLREAFPDRREFRHAEGNSTAHLKCSYVGPSQTVLIEDGKPLLGIWQGVYFCEFDGPRHRRYYIKVMADN